MIKEIIIHTLEEQALSDPNNWLVSFVSTMLFVGVIFVSCLFGIPIPF